MEARTEPWIRQHLRLHSTGIKFSASRIWASSGSGSGTDIDLFLVDTSYQMERNKLKMMLCKRDSGLKLAIRQRAHTFSGRIYLYISALWHNEFLSRYRINNHLQYKGWNTPYPERFIWCSRTDLARFSLWGKKTFLVMKFHFVEEHEGQRQRLSLGHHG